MRNNRGRDRELISSRNQRLSARFYWYSNLIGLKYAKCLFYLEKEFEISQARIQDLIKQNTTIISQLEKNEVDDVLLKKIYPFMSWQFVPHTKPQNVVQLSSVLFLSPAP